VNGGNIGTDGLEISSGWNRINIVSRQDFGMRDVLDVDGGDQGLDFDGLAHRSRFHVGVDRHCYIGGHLYLLFHGIEACYGESHGVSAGPDIDNGIASFPVSCDGARSFDQRLAGRFHSDTRHDGAGAIFCNAGDCALRRGCRREQRKDYENRKEICRGLNGHLPSNHPKCAGGILFQAQISVNGARVRRV